MSRVSWKLSCTVLRGGAVGNDGSLLDQDTASSKQPWYFTARDGSPVLTIAGLWDQWKNKETGERIKSCTMIITEPNDFVAEVHDRMPVWPAPGFEDTEIGVFMEPEVDHGETKIYAGVQA